MCKIFFFDTRFFFFFEKQFSQNLDKLQRGKIEQGNSEKGHFFDKCELKSQQSTCKLSTGMSSDHWGGHRTLHWALTTLPGTQVQVPCKY